MIEQNHLLSAVDFPAIRSGPNRAVFPEFSENEIVRGRVLKSLSATEFLIQLKGQQITAKTHLCLKEGSVIVLKVEKPACGLTFKLMQVDPNPAIEPKPSVVVAAVRDNLWATVFHRLNTAVALNKTGGRFIQVMDRLSQKIFMEPASDMLKKLIDQCGICWEKKLRNLAMLKRFDKTVFRNLLMNDLKALACENIVRQEEPALMEKFVSVLDHIQMLNHIGLEEGRKFFLPIPMCFPDGCFTLGQMLIQLPVNQDEAEDASRGGRQPVRITFLLNLSRLGPLRVDLTLAGKAVSGRFVSPDASSQAILKKRLPVFVRHLIDKGFTIGRMACDREETDPLADTLVNEIVSMETCSVRIVV